MTEQTVATLSTTIIAGVYAIARTVRKNEKLRVGGPTTSRPWYTRTELWLAVLAVIQNALNTLSG